MHDIESTIYWSDIHDPYQEFLKANPHLVVEESAWTKEEIEAWQNRHKVPKGLNKKQLTALQKETQKKIDALLLSTKDPKINLASKYFLESLKEDWIGKKTQIKNILKFHSDFGTEQDITKAKAYPIDQLIQFEHGFTKCVFHDEKSPSMKYYPKQNKVHCFGGCGSFDAIDVCMKINNLTFNEAVKRLS